MVDEYLDTYLKEYLIRVKKMAKIAATNEEKGVDGDGGVEEVGGGFGGGFQFKDASKVEIEEGNGVDGEEEEIVSKDDSFLKKKPNGAHTLIQGEEADLDDSQGSAVSNDGSELGCGEEIVYSDDEIDSGLENAPELNI